MLENEFKYIRNEVDKKLKEIFHEGFCPSVNLENAIRYSTVSQGKRLRPLLCYMLGKNIDLEEDVSIILGVAIELIHCYTLVHDDLPAMDNDDYRRGLPSNHKKFNEYTAILVGDALQSEAFNLLSSEKLNIPLSVKLKIINRVSEIAGAKNLISGQVMDLDNHKLNQNFDISYINNLKTSKLISLCFEIVSLAKGQSEEFINKIVLYGDKIGFLYQIIDDFKDLQEQGTNLVREKGNKEALNLFYKIYEQSLEILKDLNLEQMQIINKYFLYKVSNSGT